MDYYTYIFDEVSDAVAVKARGGYAHWYALMRNAFHNGFLRCHQAFRPREHRIREPGKHVNFFEHLLLDEELFFDPWACGLHTTAIQVAARFGRAPFNVGYAVC